jgi:hypothetical protein
MSWRLFGPSRAEIDAISYDLIVRHGLGAYDEAIHLSQVARRLLRSRRKSELYRLAARQIERSMELPRTSPRQKQTSGAMPR